MNAKKSKCTQTAKTRDVEEMLKEAKESHALDEGNKTTSDN